MFSMACSDTFAWGCADAETIMAEDIPLLRQTLVDLKAVGDYSEMWLGPLFCARKRDMRPMNRWMKGHAREGRPRRRHVRTVLCGRPGARVRMDGAVSTADDLSRRLAAVVAKTPGQLERLAEITARIEEDAPVPASGADRDVLQSALYEVVRAELDDSLAFIAGRKLLPRRQRRVVLGPAVRDYVADEIAWKVLGVVEGSASE